MFGASCSKEVLPSDPRFTSLKEHGPRSWAGAQCKAPCHKRTEKRPGTSYLVCHANQANTTLTRKIPPVMSPNVEQEAVWLLWPQIPEKLQKEAEELIRRSLAGACKLQQGCPWLGYWVCRQPGACKKTDDLPLLVYRLQTQARLFSHCPLKVANSA